jgi:hypothetical protein
MGSRLMGSFSLWDHSAYGIIQLMGSFSLWDHSAYGIIQPMGSIFLRYPRPVSTVSQAKCVSIIGIIRLTESVCLGPKVIPLSSTQCT